MSSEKLIAEIRQMDFSRIRPTSLAFSSQPQSRILQSQQEHPMRPNPNTVAYLASLMSFYRPGLSDIPAAKPQEMKINWEQFVLARFSLLRHSGIASALGNDFRTQAWGGVEGMSESYIVEQVQSLLKYLPVLESTPVNQRPPAVLIDVALACLVKCRILAIEHVEHYHTYLFGEHIVQKPTAEHLAVIPRPNVNRVYHQSTYTPTVVDQLLAYTPPDVHSRDDLTALFIDLVAAGLLDEHRAFARISHLRNTSQVSRGMQLSDTAASDVHQSFAKASEVKPTPTYRPPTTFGMVVPSFLVDLADGLKEPTTEFEPCVPMNEGEAKAIHEEIKACAADGCVDCQAYVIYHASNPVVIKGRTEFLNYLREAAKKAQAMSAEAQNTFGTTAGDAIRQTAEQQVTYQNFPADSEYAPAPASIGVAIAVSQATHDELNQLCEAEQGDYVKAFNAALTNPAVTDTTKSIIRTILAHNKTTPGVVTQIIQEDTISGIVMNPDSERPLYTLTEVEAPNEELGMKIFEGRSIQQIAEAFEDEMAKHRANYMAGRVAADDVRGFMGALQDTQAYATYILQALHGLDHMAFTRMTTELEMEIFKAHLRQAVTARQIPLRDALRRLHAARLHLDSYQANLLANQKMADARKEAAAKYLVEAKAKVSNLFAEIPALGSLEKFSSLAQLDDWLNSYEAAIGNLRTELYNGQNSK